MIGIARGIDFKSEDHPGIQHTISASYQQELWGDEREEPVEDSRGIPYTTAFANSGLQSHVLLAACSPEQSAYEDCGTREGRFTSAFLNVLEVAGTDTMTYSELIRRLDKLPSCALLPFLLHCAQYSSLLRQTPQCEGRDKDKRIVFDAGLIQRDRDCFPVQKSAPSYALRAGRSAGLKEGDVFAVFRDRQDYASAASPLLNLVVDAVGAEKSSASPVVSIDLSSLDNVPQAVAVLTRATHLSQRDRTCYGLTKSVYTLRAGQVHGVSEGDVFTIYKDRAAYNSARSPIGELVVDSVKAVTSSMSPFEGTDLHHLDSALYPVAVLAHVGVLDAFRIHVDVKKHPQLLDLVATALTKETLGSHNRFGRSIVLSTVEMASISIVPAAGDSVDFIILDGRIRALKLSKLSGTVLRDVQSLRAALRSASHFFYHLGSSPTASKRGLSQAVSMRLWETVSRVDFTGGIPMPVYKRVTEVVDFKTSGSFRPRLADPGLENSAVAYGVDVVNISPHGGFDLFVWLFYFDCSTLEISKCGIVDWVFSYYELTLDTQLSYQSRSMDHPPSKMGMLEHRCVLAPKRRSH